VLGTQTLNPAALATFSTSTFSVGLHEIEAVYSGNGVYPPTVSQPVWIAVGSNAQVRMLRFVQTFQQNINVQISQPQINRWLTWLDHGVRPRVVARSIVRWVYFRSHLPPGGTIAARSNAVRQSDHSGQVRSKHEADAR
jgi:hypothetical protein